MNEIKSKIHVSCYPCFSFWSRSEIILSDRGHVHVVKKILNEKMNRNPKGFVDICW